MRRMRKQKMDPRRRKEEERIEREIKKMENLMKMVLSTNMKPGSMEEMARLSQDQAQPLRS